MKKSNIQTCIVVALVILMLLLDQWTKWYVKTHFYLYDSYAVFGDWFKIYFIENKGMAFGFQFGDSIGKLLLTTVRLIAIVVGFYLFRKLIRAQVYPLGILLFGALIYAGAIGNTLDSVFYGVIYGESTANTLSTLFPEGGGYGTYFHGSVVDMLYFPLIRTTYPEWIPFWGGKEFEFFSFVFNIADACVSVGIAGLIIFYYKKLPAFSFFR